MPLLTATVEHWDALCLLSVSSALPEWIHPRPRPMPRARCECRERPATSHPQPNEWRARARRRLLGRCGGGASKRAQRSRPPRFRQLGARGEPAARPPWVRPAAAGAGVVQ